MSVRKIEVTYSRTVQPREYESKHAAATIGVELEDGEADVKLNLEASMQQAMEVVLKAVGRIPVDAVLVPVADQPAAPEKGTSVEGLTAGQKSARTRKANKAKKDAERAKEDAAADAAVIGDAAEPVVPDDEPDADGADEAEDEYSNSDLQKMLNAKVKELMADDDKDAVKKVKAAVAAFEPKDHDGPFIAADLNLKQRRKLVGKLEAM